MDNNKQLALNMAASILTYVVSIGINFFLTPYIVGNVGIEAYGFVGLANNFISYASLITIALNSIAGRFITVKIHEKDEKGANIYFSSVFYANIILTFLMGIIFTFWVIFLEKTINIPRDIITDVKILFATLFLNCLIGTVGAVFTVSTFSTNKLYLNSARQMEASVIKMFLLLFLFCFFTPKISYLGLATLITGIYCFVFNIYYTKTLLPHIRIKKIYFNMKSVFEILSSGIWNLVTRIGQLLQDGLDLLITNLFIDATMMGVLSVAKIIPSIISGLVGSTVGIFSPNFTILYAENKDKELIKSVEQSMKIMGVFANLPIIVLIVCGELFFSLWQPTQNAGLLQKLSVLTCAGLIFNGGINCIYDTFTVVNKLKLNSIFIFITGALNIIAVYILLKTTDLGIYAVAGTSTVIATLRNLLFTVPYGAKCLGLRWNYFYPYVARPVVFVMISCGICISIRSIIGFNGWLGLIGLGLITFVLALLIGGFVILNKADRNFIIKKIMRKKDASL